MLGDEKKKVQYDNLGSSAFSSQEMNGFYSQRFNQGVRTGILWPY